jgi:Fe-S cluster assembly scaffold protein SufB
MGIQSFLQANKGDPDWLYSPDEYFGKQFKLSEPNMVELKEGRKDSVVLRHNPTEKGLIAKHLKIDLRDNSSLDLTILNDTTPKLQQVCLYDIHIREGATLNLGVFVKGGKLNKHIFQIEIDDGANLSNYGYMNNNDSGDTEIIFKIYQKGVESLCTQLIAGEAGPNSQTVYQSMVHIDEGAEMAETGIENVNIITGSNGKCYSKPEIDSHNETTRMRYGSQTAFIDDSMLLYLNSKGLTEGVARNLILEGFKNTVFDLIPQEELQQEVRQMFDLD